MNGAGNIYYYVQAAPLVVSNPRLGEKDLEQAETAPYLFDVTNTAPGTVLQGVNLSLLYDKAGFTGRGVTVSADSVALPGSLAYGQAVTVKTVLTAGAGATLGAYGFYGVTGKYQVVPVPSQSAPVASGAGGWMPFTVVAP